MRRRRAAQCLRQLVVRLVVAALLLLHGSGALASTFSGDKKALLAFKAGLTDSATMLNDWSKETDPCGDGWTGVKCDCKDFFYSVNNSMMCSPPALPDNVSRVLQINFGDPRITQWNTLKGTISPALGNLTELRVLNLQSNNLYGSLPVSLAAATSLEQLLVGDNRLTGSLPAWLGALTDLKYVWLNNNYFMGRLPREWCSGAWWQFRVEDNAGLCDEVPPCLRDRILSFEGTSLIDTVDDADGGEGGYCGVAPPVCVPDRGCKFLSPEPPFWTNATSVAFSFSDFDSPSNSGPMKYRWAIGSSRGGRDVLDWLDFQGFTSVQPVQNASGWVNRTVYYVDTQLEQVTLKQGQQYYVVVQGINDAGVQLATTLSSEAILVDWTPPELPAGSAVYSGEHLGNEPFQTSTDSMAASWDAFVDQETGVQYYSYQVHEFKYDGQGSPGYVGPPLTGKTRVGLERSVYIIDLALQQGGNYFVRVFAMNGAGLEGYRDAPPVRVVSGGTSSGLAVSKVVVLVAVLVGATSACVAVITVYIVRERFRRRQVARKQLRGQLKNFKYLMTGLVKQLGDPTYRHIEGLQGVKELAFVITDLEDSTALSSSCPKSFDKVQEMHDSLLRELIQRHDGYEINTEGDAFHVAFTDIHSAVQFCLDVQYQMMEQEWPAEVLRLPKCKEVKGPDDSLIFRGPRIRMGVHWALEGTVAQRLHQLTKHRIFTGPAFQVTRDLCEAAHGGQVLMSHDAWVRLRQDMAAANFPVVEQLGLYKAPGWLAPLWIYQATQYLGKPLSRLLGPVRELAPVESGWGLCIMPPPMPRSSKGLLTFVSARTALECCSAGIVSSAMGRRLYELLATVAQQFQGYIFRLSESQGCYLLVFSSAVDAVRFCHAGQALLMYSHWPVELQQDYSGPAEVTADNRLVFKGPRMAMAVHESDEYSCMTISRKQASAEELAMDYVGPAEEFVKLLSEVTHGGQVVVSETAWAAVQDQLPGQAQVVSLGTHVLDEVSFPQPVMLMEVMPSVLAKRSFPPPLTARMVEAGYRDAPDVDSDMAIVFVKVSKPAEVKEAEQAQDTVSDDTMIRVITAYNVGLNKAVKLMRQLLPDYDGYECKEPEAGKITVAFRTLDDAVLWGCHVQRDLMCLPWPDPVLTWQESAEVVCPETGQLVWRGLRVRMGMAYGLPTSKAPLNTGRADYFGALPNLAARLMSLAQPGQILVHGHLGSMRELVWTCEDHSSGVLGGPAGEVELTQLGYFQVKGIEGSRLVYQARLSTLDRHFEPHPGAVRLSSPSSALSRLLSMRMRVGSEAEPSATPRHFSVRTPHCAHNRPRVFTSISRSNSVTTLPGRLGSLRSARAAACAAAAPAATATAALGRAGSVSSQVEPRAPSCASLSCLLCYGGYDGPCRAEAVVPAAGLADEKAFPPIAVTADGRADERSFMETVEPRGHSLTQRSFSQRLRAWLHREQAQEEASVLMSAAPSLQGDPTDCLPEATDCLTEASHPLARRAGSVSHSSVLGRHSRLSSCSNSFSVLPAGSGGVGVLASAGGNPGSNPDMGHTLSRLGSGGGGVPPGSGAPSLREVAVEDGSYQGSLAAAASEDGSPPTSRRQRQLHPFYPGGPPSRSQSPRKHRLEVVSGPVRPGGSPPRFAVRDTDWSYPGSTLGSPTSHRSAAMSDWDAASFSLDLRHSRGRTSPVHRPSFSQRSSPTHHRHPGSVSAFAAFASAQAGGGGVDSASPLAAGSPFSGPSRSDSMLSTSTLGALSAAAQQSFWGGVAGLGSGTGNGAAADPPGGGEGAAAAPAAVAGGTGHSTAATTIHVSAFVPRQLAEPGAGAGGSPQQAQQQQPAARRPHLQLEISEPTNPEGSSLDIVTPGFLYARQIAQLFVEGRRRTVESNSRTSWLPMPSRFRGDSSAAQQGSAAGTAAAQQPAGGLPGQQDQGASGGGGSSSRWMSPKRSPRLSPRKSPRPSPRPRASPRERHHD